MEFTELNLQKTLEEIIKPQYKKNINDWLFDAKPNERKGLFVISKIIKHKGEKCFRDKLDQTKNDEELTMENAYKRYQKRTYSSSYKDDYFFTCDPKFRYNNILKHTKFDLLNYSEMIENKYSEYITKWALLEEAEQYKEWVLDFVRSFYSTCKSSLPNQTIYQKEYTNYKFSDQFTKHGVFIPPMNNKNTTVPTVEEMKERLGLQELKKKYELKEQNIKYNDNLQNQEEIIKMKKELVCGQKNLLKGIYADTFNSHYKETFKGMSEKFKIHFKPDFYTSGVKGKLPDPYEQKRIASHRTINSALKQTVKNVLFK